MTFLKQYRTAILRVSCISAILYGLIFTLTSCSPLEEAICDLTGDEANCMSSNWGDTGLYGAWQDTAPPEYSDSEDDEEVDEEVYEECGNVPYEGCCEGTILRYCDGSRLVEFDCSDEGETCGWYEDDEYQYYNCVPWEAFAEPTGTYPIDCPP